MDIEIFTLCDASKSRRIVISPDTLGGQPHIRGTRIPVKVILDGLADGMTTAALIEHFPRLTPEDVQAAIEFAAEPGKVIYGEPAP